MVQKAHIQTNSANTLKVPDILEQMPLTGWVRNKGWNWFPH